MSLLLAAVALAQVTGAPAPADEISVIGRRFDQMSATVRRDGQGRYTCNLSATSGDLRLDERLCKAATACVRKGALDKAQVTACIERKKPSIFEAFRGAYGNGART